jgi:hypothetical protein
MLLVHLDQRSMWTIAITWRPSSVCKLFTFQASSPKPLCQLEPNLAGMFLGWSSTNLLFFVPVGYSTWLPGPIICSDWLKFQRSSSLKLMNWLNPNCNDRQQTTDNGRRMTDDGCQVMAIVHLDLWSRWTKKVLKNTLLTNNHSPYMCANLHRNASNIDKLH